MPTGLPGSSLNLQRVQSDSSEEAVYFGGAIKIDTAAWFETNPVLRYADGQWDTLGRFNNIVHSITVYHDTLIVGGDFTMAEGISVSHIACFSNGQWHPYGSFDSRVRQLKILDGTLYAVGPFVLADGDTCYGAAQRTGSQWTSVASITPTSFGGFVDIEGFNGNLVIVGPVTAGGGHGIFFRALDEWVLLGPGISGSLSSGRCLSVFQGSLFIGGQISTSEGNVGQSIMRWDGSQFHSVGNGIWWELGSPSTATVTSLAVHDDLLFVGGGFHFAGDLPVEGLVTWDGVQWCRVPGGLTSEAHGIWSMAFYQDTLFIATINDSLDGEFTNRAAKFIGTSYADSCSGPVNIPEPATSSFLSILYDVQTSSLSFTLQSSIANFLDADLQLFDPLGRLVLAKEFRPNEPVSVATLPSGVYVARVSDKQGILAVQRFAKQ